MKMRQKENFQSPIKAEHQNTNFGGAFGSSHKPSSAQGDVGHQPSRATGEASSNQCGACRNHDPSRLPTHGWIGFETTTIEAVFGGGTTYNEMERQPDLAGGQHFLALMTARGKSRKLRRSWYFGVPL
ncbi:LOW QUALITY PROTEIN: hypothetical protein M514_20858 [Trichuris suis]|uniref:Uncharacterized protein n=1 Tax=Trichuris suis TaxID=68888 RepID=A0A085NBZ6_9BILA|nr:LOW QUALITY PROTEIN: hypothetical protein M514_20858 [Trichuris suis]